MNKATKVRQVYHELRQVVGDRASAREVLEYAHSLVKLFATDDAVPACDLRTGGLPFENWALDVAFADGGWRVFLYEMRHNGAYYSGEDWEGVEPDFLEGYVNLEEYTCQM